MVIPFLWIWLLALLPQHHVSLNKNPATPIAQWFTKNPWMLSSWLFVCLFVRLFVCLFVFLAFCSWFMISSSIEEYANGGGQVSFISKHIALMIVVAKTGRVSSKKKKQLDSWSKFTTLKSNNRCTNQTERNQKLILKEKVGRIYQFLSLFTTLNRMCSLGW